MDRQRWHGRTYYAWRPRSRRSADFPIDQPQARPTSTSVLQEERRPSLSRGRPEQKIDFLQVAGTRSALHAAQRNPVTFCRPPDSRLCQVRRRGILRWQRNRRSRLPGCWHREEKQERQGTQKGQLPGQQAEPFVGWSNVSRRRPD